MKLYLITGFLGAGKTSFLKNLIQHFEHKKLYIIINEFGKIGVDAKILSNLGAVLSEINNGSIFCACRLDKFESALENAIKEKPDIILVEASGLSNPVHIERVMSNSKFSSDQLGGIIDGGSICIVDALRLQSVIETATVCKNQIAVSSLAIINKCDIASAEQIEQTRSLLQKANPFIHIEQTSWGTFKAEWFNYVQPMTALVKNETELDNILTKPDITLQKSCILFCDTKQSGMTAEQMESLVKLIAPDTYRIKGFVQIAGIVYLVDCVGPHIAISVWESNVPSDSINRIVILAGKGMPLRNALQNAKQWYPHLIETIE